MIYVAKPYIDEEEIEAVVEVLKSGLYTSGRRVEDFERAFGDYIGSKYAVACNSGTAALHMSLLALYGNREYREPIEIIVPPMTFFATISAVVMAGCEPVFVDVKKDCNIDEKYIEEAITPNTKGIIPVHFFGKPCNMDAIIKIAKKYNLDVIEDCAQAHGATIGRKKVGSFGACGCFSFFATKNMTTIEGGIITTDRKDIYEKAKLLRSHGMTDRDTHSMIGYNYRMNEVSAAIGLAQLRKLDMLNEKRIANSEYLFENIEKHKIAGFNIDRKIVPGHVYFWYPVGVEWNLSDDFKDYLKRNGIGFRHRYTKPLYKQPAFRGKYNHLNLHCAENLSGNVIGLPNHPGMTKDELDKVIEVVNNYGPYSYDRGDT